MFCNACGRSGPVEDFQMDETVDNDEGGKTIISTDLNCPACGSDDIADSEDSEECSPMGDEIDCPNCGMVSPDPSDFEDGCQRCGYTD